MAGRHASFGSPYTTLLRPDAWRYWIYNFPGRYLPQCLSGRNLLDSDGFDPTLAYCYARMACGFYGGSPSCCVPSVWRYQNPAGVTTIRQRGRFPQIVYLVSHGGNLWYPDEPPHGRRALMGDPLPPPLGMYPAAICSISTIAALA